MVNRDLKIVECPRDAMQGVHSFIPTEQKINYINALLDVGFDTIDVGSFVSPKVIPQLKDTSKYLDQIKWKQSDSKLLTIVANVRGARLAESFDQVDYMGFPFSISPTFQLRNTNKTIAQSYEEVQNIQEICLRSNKELIVYLSMGFGNPYGEEWNTDIVEHWVEQLDALGIKVLSLSDTIGTSTPEAISQLFSHLIPAYPHIEMGAHLHTHAHNWKEKIDAAWTHGCKRIDTAIKGFGGCPMAEDVLVGNMPTENLLTYCAEHKIETGLNTLAFESAYNESLKTFPS